MDRGRRIPAHYAVAIAIDGTGACDLHHGSEPARAARSPVAVPLTLAAAAKRDLLGLSDRGPIRPSFTVGIAPQVAGKPVVTSRLSEGERVPVNGEYVLRRGPRVIANEPPASAAAKRSRLS